MHKLTWSKGQLIIIIIIIISIIITIITIRVIIIIIIIISISNIIIMILLSRTSIPSVLWGWGQFSERAGGGGGSFHDTPKIDFQDGRNGYPIRTILAIFDYKSPRYILPSFKSSGISAQENKFKIFKMVP